MDKELTNTEQKTYEENLFNLVRENYHKVNSEYIKKQIKIASEYLSPEQKKELKDKGLID